MDAALHGFIRTTGGRVYIFAADDTPQRKATGPGIIHAYRANQLGIPTTFTEVDALRRPSATGVTHVVGSPDVRLAADGTAHMVYTDETNATLWYQTFSTVTDTWACASVSRPRRPLAEKAIKRETSNALVLQERRRTPSACGARFVPQPSGRTERTRDDLDRRHPDPRRACGGT
jgi:hypothetical protein